MLVATLGPSAEGAGRVISYEDGRFTLEGFGPITPRAVLDYDRQGQLLWASEGTRAWVSSLTVTAPPTAAAEAPKAAKRGLGKGVRIALVIGIVLVVAIVIAAAVMKTDDGTSTPAVSSSELRQRLAGQMPAAVAVHSCRVSDGGADVVLKDSTTDTASEFLATAQRDCFDAFRALFAAGGGVTAATVEVRIEASDQFGLSVWDPIYRASLSGEVAAKVDWQTASPAEVAKLWTVEFRKEYMTP